MTKLKQFWKWILAATAGVALASAGVDIAILTETERLNGINTVQTQELSKGHYKHIPRTHIKGNDYQVDEYELPTGEVGYTITRWKTENEKEMRSVIDYGSLNRDKDWTVIRDLTATST